MALSFKCVIDVELISIVEIDKSIISCQKYNRERGESGVFEEVE